MKYRLQQLAGIKSLYEQQESSCVSITYNADCPQNPNQGSSIQGSFPNNKCIFINNQTPQVGDGFRFGGPNDIFKVTSVTPNPNGTSNQYYDTASCGDSGGCTLQDFQQAASGITLPAPFLGNIYNKFANHPDGCRFLNKRMQIQMQGSSNPTAAAQKANKVQAFQAIIAQCCK